MKADETLAAWRDFAIGLGLFFVAQQSIQSLPALGMAAFAVGQALFVVATVVVHVILYRLGRFPEVTESVFSFGRLSASRLSVVGVAALVLMFGVWRIAQIIGGTIERPIPWLPADFDPGIWPLGYILAISFYVVVTVPVIEELCFRGWMQRGLGQRFNPAITIATPALLFAALHDSNYSNPAYLLIPLALGLTLGLVAERSRSLWPAVVLHALWNGAMLAMAVSNGETPLSWRAPVRLT